MRDLKHLIYFENLLENADNELVKQAQADGGLAIGYTCYHMPEPLLNLGNCFSVRLRAPRLTAEEARVERCQQGEMVLARHPQAMHQRVVHVGAAEPLQLLRQERAYIF